MNCLYLPGLVKSVNDFKLPVEEIKHLKALRISNNENIMVTNGKGLSAEGKINFIKKDEVYFSAYEYSENFGENTFRLGLALGILDNRDRFEFALEKAVELGINDFFPLVTKYGQTQKINKERLASKAISAMKQCCRSILPIIHSPLTINELLNEIRDYNRILLADVNGLKPKNQKNEIPTLIIVGPEAGFTKEEIKLIRMDKRTEMINLGNRKLRTETAAIVALGIVKSG